MVLNIFHKLRPFHPRIDAVGVFEIEGDGYVLLLMQFSLSKYSDYGSKCSSIFEWQKALSAKIASHHNNLAKNLEPLKVVYIYISPQQFFDNGSDPWQCWEAKGVEMFGPDWLQEEQKPLSLFETVKLSYFSYFYSCGFFLCCNVFFLL